MKPEPREDFERKYTEKFPRKRFGENVVSLPCTCEDGGGPTHWAAVTNNPEMIREHESHEETLKSIREFSDGTNNAESDPNSVDASGYREDLNG